LSRTELEIKDLLDDALRFNPWVKSDKTYEPETIPPEEWERMNAERKRYVEGKDGNRTDNRAYPR